LNTFLKPYRIYHILALNSDPLLRTQSIFGGVVENYFFNILESTFFELVRGKVRGALLE